MNSSVVRSHPFGVAENCCNPFFLCVSASLRLCVSASLRLCASAVKQLPFLR